MTSVLVTDGDERAALAVVRSLGGAGFQVHVCGRRRRTLAGVSRLARDAFAAPDALREPTEFVDALAAYVQAQGIDVILPITEAALLAVLGTRARFAPATIPFPSIDTFRAASDKRALSEVATGLGIAVPRQWAIARPGELTDVSIDTLSFPVVVKPSRSVSERDGVRSKHAVRYATDASELRVVITDSPAAAYPLLLQQRVTGAGCGVFLLRWNGTTIASFAHRRIREKPPAGGVSVCAEAVALDAALMAQSERLLEALAWQGVAMVEYKVDATTGTPYLMEINGRFWGSLQLAIDAGVDFPHLLVRCALGEHVMPLPAYRVGTRGRWWWGEVDHLLARLRRTDAELSLPPGSPTRAAVIADFLTRWHPNERDAVFRLNDPMPFLNESARWFRGQ
jgi:predicted ATP-grasp superfamily ATP-dependent carboligase